MIYESVFHKVISKHFDFTPVVSAGVCLPNSLPRSHFATQIIDEARQVTLIQGPPGTGKTTAQGRPLEVTLLQRDLLCVHSALFRVFFGWGWRGRGSWAPWLPFFGKWTR